MDRAPAPRRSASRRHPDRAAAPRRFRPSPGADRRALGLGALRLARRWHALGERDALRVGGGDVELLRERVEVVLYAAGFLVQALERLQRRDVLRFDRQDLLVRLDGARAVAEPLL